MSLGTFEYILGSIQFRNILYTCKSANLNVIQVHIWEIEFVLVWHPLSFSHWMGRTGVAFIVLGASPQEPGMEILSSQKRTVIQGSGSKLTVCDCDEETEHLSTYNSTSPCR